MRQKALDSLEMARAYLHDAEYHLRKIDESMADECVELRSDLRSLAVQLERMGRR